MSDNVAVTAGSGTTIAADEVVDGTLGTVKVQYVKIMDATLDGTSKAAVGANGLAVDVKAIVSHPVTNAGTFATQSAITAASGSIASGAIASGAMASGAFASGAVSSGAFASGSIASGAMVDVGAIADAAVTAGATGSLSAKLRSISRDLVANIVLAAGTNIIGLFKLSDGTNTAAVKAASTAPVATDPALVVAISPNSVNANGQTTMSASAPVALASNQSTVSVALDTSLITNGASGTTLTPTKVKISVASATTTTLVALVSAKKIRILSMYLVSTAANTVTFQSHTTTTNNDGGAAFAANGGYVLPFNPLGWFDSTVGEALDMVTSGAGQVSGQLVYVAV